MVEGPIWPPVVPKPRKQKVNLVEPVVILYAWGLITDSQVAEYLDVPVDTLGLILDGLKAKAELYRGLAEGPAVDHYRKVLGDWSFSPDNQQNP